VQHDQVARGHHAHEAHPLARVLARMRSEHAMNASFPSATSGLCCVDLAPTYRSTAPRGRHGLNVQVVEGPRIALVPCEAFVHGQSSTE